MKGNILIGFQSESDRDEYKDSIDINVSPFGVSIPGPHHCETTRRNKKKIKEKYKVFILIVLFQMVMHVLEFDFSSQVVLSQTLFMNRYQHCDLMGLPSN